MTKRGTGRAAVCAVLAVLLAGPTWAAFRPKVTVRGGTVLVNAQPAIRFPAPNGALSVSERGRITSERLVNLVGQGVSIYSIYAKGDKWQARVCAGETMICLVSRQDARARRTSPLALAGSWAANIRSLLAMPPVVLSDKELTVPLGENRRVFVTGAATGPITTKSDKSEVAAASPGTDGRYLEITGRAVGQATVGVEVEGEIALVNVYVKKYAGTAPAKCFAEVTGSPCPTGLLSYAAAQTVLRSCAVEPGSSVRIERIDGTDTPLQPGLSRQVRVSVAIRGEGYIDYRGPCRIEIHNSVMGRDEVERLFYSNNPERFTKYQELFAGRLEDDKPTRVLYHHQNGVGKRARLLVELVNPDPAPAVFRVFRGVSAPLVDTVLVGYIASSAFLRDQFYNASVIERVPARSRMVLVSDVLAGNETSSGILQIRQTGGSGAYVRVAALPPDVDNLPVGAISPAPENVVLQLSRHVYPRPAKALQADYVVGQRWAFIPIGRHAIGSQDAQRKLDGNYGVTYQINVRVENPTGQEKKIIVLFEPSAGLASAVFIIDGSFVSAKYAKPPNEVPLMTYRLKPGEARHVRIETLPIAGSNYPATLVVRS